MATHNRFKCLAHEHYPRMQDDIEHGSMATYSKVTVDAALVDKPSAKENTSSAKSSLIGDEMVEGNAVGLSRMQVGSNARHLLKNLEI